MHADWIAWSHQISSSEVSSLYSPRSMYSNGEAVYQPQPLPDELVAALSPQQGVELLGSDVAEIGYPIDQCAAMRFEARLFRVGLFEPAHHGIRLTTNSCQRRG